MARGDEFSVVYVDGDVPQRPIQLGQLLVDSSLISEGNTNLQQCTSQDPVVYEPLQGGYPITQAEIDAGVTPSNYNYPPLNLLRYGGDPTNTTDNYPAFSRLVSVLQQSVGGQAVIPVGRYLFQSEPVITGSYVGNTSVWAYGAEFYTQNGSTFSGLKIEYTATPHIFAIYGLKINHRGNNGPEAGFELVGTANVRLKDCTVEAHGVAAAYAAFWLHNADPTDIDSGNFWAVLEDCTVRKRSGSDVGDIPIGVALIGAQNATIIRGGNIGGTVTDGVYIAPESGETYISNGVLIDGTAFEGGTRAVHVNGDSTVGISGLRIVNCRAEAYTTFITLAGSTTNGAVPPVFAGNYLVPAVSYLSNANSLYYTSLDSEIGTPRGWNVNLGGALEVWNVSGGGSDALVGRAAAAGSSMVAMKNSAGTKVGQFIQGTRTATCKLQAQSAGELEITNISGLSKSGTACANFSGTATFAASTTVTVTFPTNNEVDGNYLVLLTPLADPVGRLWVSGRGTTGFTINNSSSTSISVVWQIFR